MPKIVIELRDDFGSSQTTNIMTIIQIALRKNGVMNRVYVDPSGISGNVEMDQEAIGIVKDCKHKIDAVRAVRDKYGLSLRDAVNYIDGLRLKYVKELPRW